MSLGNSLGSHGNTTQLKDMLKNETIEMTNQYDLCSYCSSIWKFDNQCFQDAGRLNYSTSINNYVGTFVWVTNHTLFQVFDDYWWLVIDIDFWLTCRFCVQSAGYQKKSKQRKEIKLGEFVKIFITLHHIKIFRMKVAWMLP